jgi:hypothetical protein
MYFMDAGKTVSVLPEIASIFIAFIAVVIAAWSASSQRKHNRLSVRPLPEIKLRDMEGQIKVELCNNGTGPLIISKLRVSAVGIDESWECLLDAVPESPVAWTFFVGNIDGRSVRPGSSINLLEYSYRTGRVTENRFARELREALRVMTVHVSCKDIYGEEVPGQEKKLSGSAATFDISRAWGGLRLTAVINEKWARAHPTNPLRGR